MSPETTPSPDKVAVPAPGLAKAKAPALQDFGGLHDAPVDEAIKLDALDQAGLLALRSQVEARLTGIKLDEVDLVKESLIQLHNAKILQADASKRDSNVPMNQRAQVQNSIAGILTTLAKVQMELYSSEQVKRIQNAVVKVVKQLPKERQDHFFELLEVELTASEAEMEA